MGNEQKNGNAVKSAKYELEKTIDESSDNDLHHGSHSAHGKVIKCASLKSLEKAEARAELL